MDKSETLKSCSLENKYRCLWNTNAPFPNVSRIGLTFDLDLSPTDLNIDWGHLLIKDYIYLPILKLLRQSVLELSQLHKVWETNTTFTFDLLTWISIGIILLPWTIYLPSLKLVGQSVLELSVAQGEVDWHDLWPWPLTYCPQYR